MNQPQQPVRPVTPQQGVPQQQRPMQAIPAQPRPTPAMPAQPRPIPAQPGHSQQGAGGAKVAGMPTQAMPKADDHSLDPIGLVDDFDASSDSPTPSKIKAFGVAGMTTARTFKRKTYATGQGACRVRSFHGRLSDEGMQYMDDKVNEWLDQNPDIEVKIVTTSIGQYEGKIKEPALVLNVWY
jgi:hypothetical protein